MLVLTQMEPIAVVFTLPEDNLGAVLDRMRRGTMSVDAFSRDDRARIATGKLETVDNQIDPTTGTVRLKAVFDNKDRQLWPNQFVNAHLQLETRKDAIVVPAAAVQRGQSGTFVYVVGADSTAQVRNVQVGLTQGNLALIASGLQPQERVVIDGQEKLQAGSKVDAQVRPAPSSNASAGASGSTAPASPAPGSSAGSPR
jgi:multidrug efflux system membrane fusion protein